MQVNFGWWFLQVTTGCSLMNFGKILFLAQVSTRVVLSGCRDSGCRDSGCRDSGHFVILSMLLPHHPAFPEPEKTNTENWDNAIAPLFAVYAPYGIVS